MRMVALMTAFLVKYTPICDCLRRSSLLRTPLSGGANLRSARPPGLRTIQKRKTGMNIDKAAIKGEFQRHERDTGSSEVQIAILTKEIAALTEHLKANKKDHSSRYGLLRKVQNRRKLLDYLKREDLAKYQDLIKKLGIRR